MCAMCVCVSALKADHTEMIHYFQQEEKTEEKLRQEKNESLVPKHQ